MKDREIKQQLEYAKIYETLTQNVTAAQVGKGSGELAISNFDGMTIPIALKAIGTYNGLTLVTRGAKRFLKGTGVPMPLSCRGVSRRQIKKFSSRSPHIAGGLTIFEIA